MPSIQSQSQISPGKTRKVIADHENQALNIQAFIPQRKVVVRGKMGVEWRHWVVGWMMRKRLECGDQEGSLWQATSIFSRFQKRPKLMA